MKNMKSSTKTIAVLAITMALLACTRADAAPVDVTLGYTNNNVTNESGLRAEIGTSYNNLRYGLTTLTSDNRLVNYGAYGQMPIAIHNTKFSVTPQVRVEQYREESELVGSLGLGLEYALADSVRVDAVALTSKSNDNELDGESFMFGVTKSF